MKSTGGRLLVSCLLLQSFSQVILEYVDPYIHDAFEAPSVSVYDYIVVGGGTAGCPLAATLSEKYSVLVLERGGVPYDQPSVYRLEGFPFVLTTNAAQRFQSVDGVYKHRARVLGGGSSINAGFYSHADPEFLQQTGWDLEAVKDAYEWVESRIVFDPMVVPWQNATQNGLLEAGVTPFNGRTKEHILGTKIGNTLFDSRGFRHTSADLLRSGDPANLLVYVLAVVQRIIFDSLEDGSPRAIGVNFTDSSGVTKVALVKEGGEILLAAGALGSPQLLLLSGVGPVEELAKHKIPLVLDLPSIGQKITDNPMNSIVVPSPTPLDLSSATVVGISEYGTIIEGGSGGNASTVFPQMGVTGTLMPSERNDTSIALAAAKIAALPAALRRQLNQAGSFYSKILRPTSRGTLTLNSTDITQNPTVQYNYYSTPENIEACVNGSRVLAKLLSSTALASYRYTSVPESLRFLNPELAVIPEGQYAGSIPVLPDPTNYTEASQWCKASVGSLWHFHGGCRRGDSVDAEHRLAGARSLRVIDGSTWRTSPGTNPQATAMMLGRYQGRRILAERQSAL